MNQARNSDDMASWPLPARLLEIAGHGFLIACAGCVVGAFLGGAAGLLAFVPALAITGLFCRAGGHAIAAWATHHRGIIVGQTPPRDAAELSAALRGLAEPHPIVRPDGATSHVARLEQSRQRGKDSGRSA